MPKAYRGERILCRGSCTGWLPNGIDYSLHAMNAIVMLLCISFFTSKYLTNMRKSFEVQIDESHKKTEEHAKRAAEDRNKTEGRSTLKGLLDKTKKPIKMADVLHEEALKEDAIRAQAEGGRSKGRFLNEATGVYDPDITDKEKARAIRENIKMMLPDNFVSELHNLKQLRMTNRDEYENILRYVFVQANGGVDVWGRKLSPIGQFHTWSAEDCQELLRDLGEERDLKIIANAKKNKKKT